MITHYLRIVTAKTSQRYLWFTEFICVCTVLRLFFIARIPLLEAEAYYWEWSKQLAWGHFDHPPMLAYVIAFCTRLGSDSVFCIKLGSLVLSVLTTILFFMLAKDMFGIRTAITACAVVQVLPFFAAVSILAVPDAPLAFFWLLTVYLVYRATVRNNYSLWYAAGITWGLTLLSKYHGFLLIPCVGLYLFLSKNLNVWLRRKEPYIALFIGFVIFLPNLIWNIEHGLTTFCYLLGERHGSIEFSPKGPLVFIAGFLVLLSPLYAALVLCLIARIWRAAFVGSNNCYLLLLATSVSLICFFGLLSPVIETGAHWPAVGYPALSLAAIAIIMQHRTDYGMYPMQRFAVAGVVFAFILVFFIHLILFVAKSVPSQLSLAGRTYNLSTNSLYQEMFGWKELGQSFAEIVADMPDPEHTFIIAHQYRLASMMRFLAGSRFITKTTGLNV